MGEKRRLRAFKNRVLRKIFGYEMEGVTGDWRKLHNEELHDLHSLPDSIRVIKLWRMRWVGHMACMGIRRGAYRNLVGESEGENTWKTYV